MTDYKFIRIRRVRRYTSEIESDRLMGPGKRRGAFRRVLQPYGEIRCWNARTGPVPDGTAGLLLTGGSDISEGFLRQPVPDPRLIEDADPARDEWEFAALARALAARQPILAICRGLQVLNVAWAARSTSTIPGHDSARDLNVQPLRYLPGAALQFPLVNSSHHQALDRLGKGVRVEAWCRDDEVVEQARLDDYPFALGVQYHPERDPLYRPLFDCFAEFVGG